MLLHDDTEVKQLSTLTSKTKDKEWLSKEYDDLMELPHHYAFVYMNIKNFKAINMQYGHDYGDEVLVMINDLIQTHLQSDERYARIYGDHFNIILHYGDKTDIIQRIFALDSAMYKLPDPRIYQALFASFGIYYIDEKTTFVVAQERANTCRILSRDCNKRSTHYEIYEPSLYALLNRHARYEKAMYPALHKGHFHVFLQPKIILKDTSIGGAEALVRWIDPHVGMLPLHDFLPLFERNGFIRDLDIYVFEEVCKLLKRWLESQQPLYKISINVSRVHFEDVHFFQRYIEIYQRYLVPKEYIELEITESIASDNIQNIINICNEIQTFGFLCSLDDFGSGYSSLCALKDFPITTMKLDRAFFLDEHDERSKIVILGMIQLAKQLQLTTIAEGIESSTYVDFLKEAGCDMVQGYIFSKPLAIDEFESYVRNFSSP